jgi:hypothetical protein
MSRMTMDSPSTAILLLCLVPPAVSQTIVLYENDFETPNVSVVQTCGFALDQRGINFLYGSPQGIFQQQFTVETVLINFTIDGHPFYSDPSGVGGNYALGMLANVQPDLLALTFDSQGRSFINIGMDVSSIDVQGCGGPFGIADPRFRVTLVDSPGGAFAFGAGTILDVAELTGAVAPSPFTFAWSNHVIALDTSGSVDGLVTIVWDLLQSGYGAFDNLIITASDIPGDLGNDAPSADAGPDQTVNEGAPVLLDGTASSDPEDNALTFAWTQIAGPSVLLSGSTSPMPSFSAPWVAPGGAVLTFQLIVSDAELASSPSTVDVMVKNVNARPIADAGDDQSVSEGSGVALDGSASYDPDGDPLSFSWTQIGGTYVLLTDPSNVAPTFAAPMVGPIGELLSFELSVHDGSAFSDADLVTVLITNSNNAPVANAGHDQTVDEGTIVTLDGSLSSDPDGEPIGFFWTQVSGPSVLLSDALAAAPTFMAPDVVGIVALEFDLVVSDPIGGVSHASRTQVLVRELATPPDCSSARPSIESLWPPNHKLVSVGILGVVDIDDPNVQIVVTGVMQDEPIEGLGDGDTGPDAILQGSTVLLRAERSGLGDGRVYHVHFTATDAAGAQCSGVVTVCVRHSKQSACIDGGPVYDSTGG